MYDLKTPKLDELHVGKGQIVKPFINGFPP